MKTKIFIKVAEALEKAGFEIYGYAKDENIVYGYQITIVPINVQAFIDSHLKSLEPEAAEEEETRV
jgi:hypothetical protein